MFEECCRGQCVHAKVASVCKRASAPLNASVTTPSRPNRVSLSGKEDRLPPSRFHCRANMAHIRQSRLDSGLGFQVKCILRYQRCPLFAADAGRQHTPPSLAALAPPPSSRRETWRGCPLHTPHASAGGLYAMKINRGLKICDFAHAGEGEGGGARVA